jgi:glucan 1,3-beta-glucosidase
MPSSYVDTFVILLRALGLVEGSYKPIPGPLSDSLTNNNSTAYSVGYSNFIGPGFSSAPAVDVGFNFSGPWAGSSYDETIVHPPIAGATLTECSVIPYDPPPPANQAFAPFDAAAATIYRYRQQQAVNLGSW